MSWQFLLNGVNINPYIVNKPAVMLSTRDRYSPLAFESNDIKLELNRSIPANYINNNYYFMQVKRYGTVVWSGYLDLYSKIDPGKGRPLSFRAVPEMQRVKAFAFSEDDYAQIGYDQRLTNIVNLVNASPYYSNYTYEAPFLTTGASGFVELNCNQRPLDQDTWTIPAGFNVDEEPYFTDASDFLYVKNLDDNSWWTLQAFEDYNIIMDQYGPSQPPGSFPLSSSVITVANVGSVYGLNFEDPQNGVTYTHYTHEINNDGVYHLGVYGEFKPFQTEMWTQYVDKTVGDVLVDCAKLSGGLVYILNRKITFINNLASSNYNIKNVQVLELKYSRRQRGGAIEFSVNVAEDTPTSSEVIRGESLEYWYNLINDDIEIYDLKIISAQAFLPGYDLSVNNVYYGRIVSVKYDTRDFRTVELRCEKGDDL